MPLITLTSATDGIGAGEIVLRGEAIQQLQLEPRSAQDWAVVIRFETQGQVLVFQGAQATAAAIYSKIRAGM
jgi:hypothetical protein